MTVGADNPVQGDFAEAWVRALCTASGLTPARPDSDRVGLDFIVHDERHEIIRVQVRSTTAPNFHADGLHYALDVSTYNRLRVGSTPAYLIVLVLFAPQPEWTKHGLKRSMVRASGRWLDMTRSPETQNASSVTMILPPGNIVTPSSLRALFPEEEP